MKIKVRFTEVEKSIPVNFAENTHQFSAKFGEVQPITNYVGGKKYTGAYEVTPRLEKQTLPTKDKVLIDDMTVKGIEIHRVKNSSGGTTVYIAKGV